MVGKKARKIYDVDSMIKISVTVSFFEAEKSLLFFDIFVHMSYCAILGE